jgi:hypothetical protein
VSQTRKDVPSGSTAVIARAPAERPASTSTLRRWNIARDVCGAVMVLAAVFFPWNVHFGVGVPGSSGAVFAVLTVASLLSLASLAATYAGPSRDAEPSRLWTIRLALNVPYLLLVAAFLAFTLIEVVRFGGTTTLPAGIGPGAWLGLAGALLSAQPVLSGPDDGRFRSWFSAMRVVGFSSMVVATLAVVFNLFWRTRYVLPGFSGGPFGSQNLVIILSTLLYGVLALVAVIVASRWILQEQNASRLAIIVLGASTLAAGIVVWILPVGREIDAFHGIAESTSTAAVGFEGYLAWVAAAAVFGPLTLYRLFSSRPIDETVWRDASRKALLLIAIWCGGSALCRIMDLIVTATLNLPFSPYDSMTLMAFDLVTAALALWLRLNMRNNTVSWRVLSLVFAVLLALMVSRIALGVALAPRYADAGAADNPVYGNALAQQLTSTFDVALCIVALGILAMAIASGSSVRSRRIAHARTHPNAAAAPQPVVEAAPQPPALSGSPAIFRTSAATEQIPTGDDSTQAIWSRDKTQQIASTMPKIHRPAGASDTSTGQIPVEEPGEAHTQQISSEAPKIFRPLDESTKRFGAGTTYGGQGGRHRVDGPTEAGESD